MKSKKKLTDKQKLDVVYKWVLEQTQPISHALEIGQRMKDGTVVVAVDLKNNAALFTTEGVFVGDSDFDNQNSVVKIGNAGNGLHGHTDWRRITDKEASALADNWDKIAPPALQGSAAPWFWGASANINIGRVYRGGEADWNYYDRNYSRPVPVVRSGPARN